MMFLFHLQAHLHLLQLLLKILPILFHLFDLILKGNDILPSNINPIEIGLIPLIILTLQFFQFIPFESELILLLFDTCCPVDNSNPILEYRHRLGIDLRERKNSGLAATCGFCLAPDLLDDVGAERGVVVDGGLLVEDLSELVL
jgi:hypothetical protein